MHVDYGVTKECKHPDWTYGEICVKCGDCGRFERPPYVGYDFKIVTQGNEGFPSIWRHSREFGGYFESSESRKPFKCWYRSDKKMVNGETLEDILPEYWKPPKEIEYHRWWIEGNTY